LSDPVSWLQIQPGWKVIGVDGTAIGNVVQVAGDKQADIFNGLAIRADESAVALYVPGEQVRAIFPGEVTLELTGAAVATLEEYREAPPQTTFRPERPSLWSRISGWLRGNRS